MTALILDGFDHYGSGTPSASNMQAGPYAAINGGICGTPSWGPARTGTNCLVQPGVHALGGIGFVARRVVPTPGTHFFVSFGFAVDQLSNVGGNQIIAFMDGSANILFQLGWTSTGVLALYKADGVTVIGQTSGPAIVAQNWHFMEMEVNPGATQFTLRLDDAQAVNTPILTITNALIAGTIAQVGLLAGNPGSNVPPQSYMDDLFIRDNNGTVNNGWLGDRRIATLFANQDVTGTSNWTPSYYKEFGAGILTNSYMMAGNNTPQNQLAYVSANSASALDPGNSDFTLETWIRFDQLPTGTNFSTIFSKWQESVNKRSFRLIYGSSAFNGGCFQFDISTNGIAATTMIQYPFTPTVNVWHHLAIVRAAGELLLFVDGQQLGLPITDSNTYFTGTTNPFMIGNQYDTVIPTDLGNVVPGTFFCGRLDETRFTNGTGRYTATFTPPTSAFPRGSSDPDWTQVVLLAGYDNGIADESSFARTLTGNNGAVSFIPQDGPLVGKYSTVNKQVPDDNTFIAANFTNATNVFTLATQPTNGTTVTVGTKDGTHAAVYTFKTAISTAFDVLIDTTAQNTLLNFLNAINAGTGAGTKYGTGTTSNFDVNAIQLPPGQIEVVANIAGTGGNSIASTSTSTGVWNTATLTGGASIPGPTNFKLSRPPNNTTLISALQLNVRALKSDAGTASIQSTFVGALGGTLSGAVKPLTVAASYYSDIIEKDPDTTNAITPTTIVNGQFSVNRTA